MRISDWSSDVCSSDLRDVQQGAEHQRAEDADGHVALRILRLARRGGDRIEADVGEDYHRRGADHAVPAVFRVALVRREDWLPVGRIDEIQAEGAELKNHHTLVYYDDRREERRTKE